MKRAVRSPAGTSTMVSRFLRRPAFGTQEDAMDPNDPSHHNDVRPDFGRDDNATWGWVAAAVFVAVVLFIAFTSGHDATQQTAANDVSQPPASSRTMMPPAQRAPIGNPAGVPTPPASNQ